MYFALSMAMSLIGPATLVLIAYGSGVVQGGTGADIQILLSLTLVSLFSGIGLLFLIFEVIYVNSKLEEYISWNLKHLDLIKQEVLLSQKLTCGNCGTRLKKTSPDNPTAAPLYCPTCGIPYDENGKEFDDTVKMSKWNVKVGDKVKAHWYDDPIWYEGRVKEDDQGLYIELEGDRIGYLDDADGVIKS